METCFYCEKELDGIYDEPIYGYDCGLAVIAFDILPKLKHRGFLPSTAQHRLLGV